MECIHCGEPAERAYCSRLCECLEARERPKFAKRYLTSFDRALSEHPNWISEMRTKLLQQAAMSHRVLPHSGCMVIAALLLLGCRHATTPVPTPATTPSGTVATVAVSPYEVVSPFLCRITLTELSCITTMTVRLRRGGLETELARGYQFTFNQPAGSGKLSVWFGCAGENECGPGYVMGGSSTATVVPVEPARFWNKMPGTSVPYGSLGIAEADIDSGQFIQIRNRWTGGIAPAQIKAGNGIVVQCGDQNCTISLK
jgi:hypothetical protein